ncbi:MAG: radical SAM protein [Desulfurococcaceae archaeon]
MPINTNSRDLKIAYLQEREDKSSICLACERRCRIPDNHTGVCGNYMSINGVLYHVGYGRISALEHRPIEIKPLYHYWPGSIALTYSNYGCNFYCPWCQNDYLSYRKPDLNTQITPPDELVKYAVINGDDGLSASFNEPITHLDYVIDVSRIATNLGLYSMMVTNMYFTERSLRAVLEAGVDGFSADIKACPQAKRALIGLDHEVVFRNARIAVDSNAHVEIVYLVVTNTNDFDECYEWIISKHLDYLGPDTPLHINRYYPAHRWSEPPTPIEKLLEIRNYAARQGLKYIYIGNVGNPEYESTRCPSCGKIVLYRHGFKLVKHSLQYSSGKYTCSRCGEIIPVHGRAFA